ncbi:MAG: acetylglutamate kinase [Phycisphaerae bacterium]|nr:acetylglutamate kinase [Phycisphaerae bacterium]
MIEPKSTRPSNAPCSAAPMLLKLGGALLDDADALNATLCAIAALHRGAPGSLVVVHGGGSAVDRQLAALSWKSEKRDGIRITPPEHMEQIAGVLAGSLNTTLVARLIAAGAGAIGLSLADGFLAKCEPRMASDFDPGRVGSVVGGSPSLVQALLHARFLPVICSIGADSAGRLLNVNADDAATALARIIRPRLLVFLTDVSGVRSPNGATAEHLSASDAAAWIRNGTISGGMIPKVRGALESAERSNTPVVIASWRETDVLQRLERGERVGTRVIAGEQLRSVHMPVHSHLQ